MVGDGDPHAVIQPDSLHPRTATELLERSWPATQHRNRPPPCSASSKTLPSGSAPATARYLDALHLAAERLDRPRRWCGIDERADRLLNGLTGSRHGRPCVPT